MKNAVVMTVFDRTPLQLTNVFEGLAKNNPSDTAIVIVSDGAASDYIKVRDVYKDVLDIRWHEHNTVRERPGCYTIGGAYNNSAYVMNKALDYVVELGAENLFVVCSDVIIPPHTLSRCEAAGLNDKIIVGQTIDMHSGNTFCSTKQIWPMLWFMATATENAVKIGGWDEAYLRGQAFEDNDFMGRLLLEVGRMIVTNTITCFHQSHPQTAYSDDNKGFRKNEEYTRKKWNGVPFRPKDDCLTYDLRGTHPHTVSLINPKGTYTGQAEFDKSGLETLQLEQTESGAFRCLTDPKIETRSSVTEQEILILQDMFGGRLVLEIGTGLGISTRAIAHKARHVITVDNDPWIKEHVFPALEAISNIKPRESVNGISHPKYDAFFIDLDRDYEATKQAIEDCKKIAGDRRVMLVVHDTRSEEVSRAIRDAGLDLEANFKTYNGLGRVWYQAPAS